VKGVFPARFSWPSLLAARARRERFKGAAENARLARAFSGGANSPFPGVSDSLRPRSRAPNCAHGPVAHDERGLRAHAMERTDLAPPRRRVSISWTRRQGTMVGERGGRRTAR
jgi:hypothetical protein